MTDKEDTAERDINRRAVLRGAGAASGAALAGATFTGSVGAKGGKGNNGKGNNGKGLRGPPCFKDFECGDNADVYLKYEFDDESCEFVLEKYEVLHDDVEFDEHDFEFQSAGNKEGEECEPIFVEWRSPRYNVTKVTAFGGTDCDTKEDLDDGIQSPYVFETDLDAGQSDQQAAISNIQFCLEEADNGLAELDEWQVDLIYGDPIFDFSAAGSYDSQNRLLQALNSCGNTTRRFGASDDEYAHCDAEIVQDIETTADGTATAKLDPGSCDGEEFALVVYGTESCEFDGGDDQVLFDTDEDGTVDGDGVYTYEVNLPL